MNPDYLNSYMEHRNMHPRNPTLPPDCYPSAWAMLALIICAMVRELTRPAVRFVRALARVRRREVR